MFNPFTQNSLHSRELIIISVLLFTAGIPILFFFNTIYQSLNSIKDSLTKEIIILMISLFLILTIFSLFDLAKGQIVPAIITFVFGLILPGIFFIPPLFDKAKKSYLQKLSKMCEFDPNDKSIPRSLMDELVSLFGIKVISILLLYGMLFLVVEECGSFSAYIQRGFYVVKTNPECIVIYTNPDRVLCKTIDKQNNEFEKGYIVYYLQDIKGVNINWEEIGPLRLKPASTPTPTPTITPKPTETPVPTITPYSTATP